MTHVDFTRCYIPQPVHLLQNLLASAVRRFYGAACRLQHVHPAICWRRGAALPFMLTHDVVQAVVAPPAAGGALSYFECALHRVQGRATGRRLQSTSKDAPGNLVAFGAPNRPSSLGVFTEKHTQDFQC